MWRLFFSLAVYYFLNFLVLILFTLKLEPYVEDPSGDISSIMFIDYEYSGINYVAYDIANHFWYVFLNTDHFFPTCPPNLCTFVPVSRAKFHEQQ